MGGNVFPNLRRVTKGEFNSLVYEVSLTLTANIFTAGDNTILPTRSYFTKETFGDMDLIVTSDNLKPNWIHELKRSFRLNDDEVSKNGNVLSFKYKDFQVDLLLTPAHMFQSTYDYFSWNDLSNLMGRVTYKFGLKFGHKGVFVVVRDGTHEIGEILVTQSVQELCDFFKWNYEQWNHGFQTMEDAYKWVVQTPYFNKEIFAYENRNHAATIRDMKRPNYANFLVWLEQQPGLPEYAYETTEARGGYYTKEPYFSMVCAKWPHVKLQYDTMMATYNEQKLFASRFNGDIVSKITGLQNKELGLFMKWVKQQFVNNPHLRSWLLSDNFTELVGLRFVTSLKYHYDIGEEYGKNTSHFNPIVKCDHCDNPAVKRYYIDSFCESCYNAEYELNAHYKIV